jgi:hypothetical protein
LPQKWYVYVIYSAVSDAEPPRVRVGQVVLLLPGLPQKLTAGSLPSPPQNRNFSSPAATPPRPTSAVTLPPGSTDSRLRSPSFALRQSIEIPPFCSCFPNFFFSSSCLYCSCSSQSLFLQRVRTSWGYRIHRPGMEPSAQGEPSTSASVCMRVDFYFCCYYLLATFLCLGKNLMFRYYLARLGILKIFSCHDRYGMRQPYLLPNCLPY